MDWIGNTTARNLRQRDVFRIVILPYKHKGILFTWRGSTVPSKLQFNFLTRLIWRVTKMSKRFCQGSRTCHSAPPRYDNKCMSAHPHEKDKNKTWSSVSTSSLSKTFALCQFKKLKVQKLCFLPPNIFLGLKKNESKNYFGSEKKFWSGKKFRFKKILGLKKVLGLKFFWIH